MEHLHQSFIYELKIFGIISILFHFGDNC